MKLKEWEQLKNKPEQELEDELKKSKDYLWNLQVDLKAGKIKNVREVKELKRKIARINTILNSKLNQNETRK